MTTTTRPNRFSRHCKLEAFAATLTQHGSPLLRAGRYSPVSRSAIDARQNRWAEGGLLRTKQAGLRQSTSAPRSCTSEGKQIEQKMVTARCRRIKGHELCRKCHESLKDSGINVLSSPRSLKNASRLEGPPKHPASVVPSCSDARSPGLIFSEDVEERSRRSSE
jgi:hypothetical protein